MMSSPASRRRLAAICTAQAPAPLPAIRSTSGENCIAAPSVARGRAGRPARVVDPEEMAARTGGWVDRDQFDRAPRRLLGEAITALGERRQRLRRKAAALII